MTADCVLDTNILLYLVNPAAPEHIAVKRAIVGLLTQGQRVAIVPQVLFEFWSVATRPVGVNGLGWSVAQARAEADTIRARFLMLEEPPAVVDLWLGIATTHGLKGKRVHDAHLLATMKANGVTCLLTLNTVDFPADSGVTIVTPEP
jgi:predicted nucleic acid-binding protein